MAIGNPVKAEELTLGPVGLYDIYADEVLEEWKKISGVKEEDFAPGVLLTLYELIVKTVSNAVDEA